MANGACNIYNEAHRGESSGGEQVNDYTDLPNDELVAEVARRMIDSPLESGMVEVGTALGFLDGVPAMFNAAKDFSEDSLLDYWQPMSNANDLEHVKREIERRDWNWRVSTSLRNHHYHVTLGFPGERGAAHADTEPRAWLIAFLRATDKEKGK